MTQVLTVDPLFFLPTPNNRYDWLKPREDTYFYNYIHKYAESLNELHEGKKPTREWNEELQAVFDLKIPNSIENLQKEKLLSSLYNNFKDSAIEVIILLILFLIILGCQINSRETASTSFIFRYPKQRTIHI